MEIASIVLTNYTGKTLEIYYGNNLNYPSKVLRKEEQSPKSAQGRN